MNGYESFYLAAIEEAKKCVSEGGHVRPKVGAIAVQDGKIIASAHRGLNDPGAHAEFILLEDKLKGVRDLSKVIVFTTLEPCIRRNEPKKPCAVRLIARGIKHVVIGMVDPDDHIRGRE